MITTVIGLFYKTDHNLNILIKNYGGRYSASCRCWYLQKNKIQLQKLALALSEVSGYKPHGFYEKEELVRTLELKGYSPSTKKTYKDAFAVFTDHFDERENKPNFKKRN